MSYILHHKSADDCVFCQAVQVQPDGIANYIIQRGQHAFVILNRFPYTSGHLMVLPYQHCPNMEDLQPQTRSEMMELINTCVRVLQIGYRPQGFNLGANLGAAAGAGLPQHFHFHIVPRWMSDTNFMSAIGETRVVPEALEQTYERICRVWKELES